MNIHEFQAKMILREYGVPIPEFVIVTQPEEVEPAIDTLGVDAAVVKIQVHAGGRGKAGGVKLARSRDEIIKHANDLLGMKIVNTQTGKEGVIAHQLMITPIVNYIKEYYIGAVIDRKSASATLIASPEGGMEIEEVAAKSPDKIIKLPIELNGSMRSWNLVRLAKFMGWKGETAKQGIRIAKALAKAFIDCDASLLEINPLVETESGEILAIDAKMGVDENALFRQKTIEKFFDPTQVSPKEVEANKHDLAYIALDGNIGCMVNGAGLAMATMDLIQHHGGSPANFLDVGGGANQERVAEGFKILLSDPDVKAILVNIFGGIMSCITIAAGIVAAASTLKVTVPLVVRMEGTNVEQGRKILANSGLNITIADDLTEAAKKTVAAAK